MTRRLKDFAIASCPSLVAAYHTFRSSREMFRHTETATPFGFRMRGHGSMQSGAFEPEETALVCRLLPEVQVFVDVGANVGFFSCLARQAGKHVIAVEPSHQNLKVLLANVSANGWDDIEVYPVALGSRPGVTTLYGTGTAASAVPRWSGTSEVWASRVPALTLDLVLGTRFEGQRLLIKADVEGLEFAVLEGSHLTLRRDPAPIFLVEICLTEHHPGGRNPHFAMVFETFWRHGYESRTADAARRLVSPGDVARWVRDGRRDFGTINFLFRRPGPDEGQPRPHAAT